MSGNRKEAWGNTKSVREWPKKVKSFRAEVAKLGHEKGESGNILDGVRVFNQSIGDLT